MPCFTPLQAWKGPGGLITLNRNAGWSDRPLSLPCGKCVGCRERKAREWALRCLHEAQMHKHNSFITLTYSPEALPNDGGLRIGDFQRFSKRLRKRVGRFRFYHCGEYGSRNLRPHYHALLFGIDFHQDRVLVQESPYSRYRSATLESVWGLGRCDIGNITYESAAYCARYVHKADVSRYGRPGARVEGVVDQDTDDPRYARVDPVTGESWQVRPEYSTMSRRPGIGSAWVEKYHADVYPSDEVVHNGRKFPVPRFYDAKVALFPSKPGEPSFADLVEEAKVARRRSAERHKEDSSGERLAVRERCAVARLRLRRREL